MNFNDIYQSKIFLIKEWIFATLDNYNSQKIKVSDLNFLALDRYFEKPLLDNSYVIYCDNIPIFPLTSIGLSDFSEMSTREFRGMTYLNHFFIKQEQQQNELLHFHELVHVIQWNYLGIDKFLYCYAYGLLKHGYRNSLLEEMAYQLEEKFNLGERIDIEKFVLSKMHYFDDLLLESHFAPPLKS